MNLILKQIEQELLGSKIEAEMLISMIFNLIKLGQKHYISKTREKQ
jgi:hypothetical protein